jgi:hypothetical protein
LVGNFSAQTPPKIFGTIFANAVNMLNKGFELRLNAQFIQNNNFSLNSTFTGSYNKNEIVSLSSKQYKGSAQDITDIIEDTPIQRLAAGHPVAAFYGRVFAGFKDNGEKWLFKNSEGKAVPENQISTNDYTYLGNSIPRYNMGFTTNFRFWNFNVKILLKSALGFNAVNAKRIYYDNLTRLGRFNLFESALHHGIKAPPIFSSYYVENGNYLKIKELTIGYTFPVQSLGVINKLRIYLTCENLATITGFSGLDPELPVNWSNGPGLEPFNNYYPTTRMLQFGLNISL